MGDPLKIINGVFGIIYFVAWSIGFYYQIALIYRLKSGEGFSLDNQLLSNIGMIYYCVYNTYYMITVRADFESILDVVYSVQAVFLGLWILAASLYFPHGINKFNFSVGVVLAIVLMMALTYYVLGVRALGVPVSDLWFFLGITESWVCVVKYLYQIFLNYDKKSTVGYAIEGVWGDILGAVCSLLQFVINKVIDQQDINWAKVLLAIISVVFDIVLLYQHYLVYKNRQPSIAIKHMNEKLVDES